MTTLQFIWNRKAKFAKNQIFSNAAKITYIGYESYK